MLGPLEVRAATGRPLIVRRRKQRALLALLVLRAGRPVSTDEIIDALWGLRPPASARANAHSYISELRQLLIDADRDEQLRLARSANGYVLESTGDSTDAARFERLLAAGRTAMATGRPAEAAGQFAAALDLWRGQVLEDLRQYDWTMPFVAHLEEARLTAMEDRAAARLELGQHAELVTELSGVVPAHPLRERLWQQYMVALNGAGRRTDALRAYERLRSALGSELAVQPSPALRSLALSISSADAQRLSPSRPAQLPADVADFTGRTVVARRLAELVLGGPAAASRPAPPVAGITGMAGVGKTTLAVHVAHRVAASFPDGQLFVNLQGAGDTALDATEVLGRMLRALGVDGRAVPHHLVERAAMYRSRMAGRRTLVVLDNAASESQVRPLLPGSPACAVLLTGRTQLTGVEGTRWIDLDVLGPDEAVLLLRRIVDDHRIADQPGDAAEIARLCGGLPLALRIAGARLTARPGWRVSHLTALLRDERQRLRELSTGDLAVGASLALSYRGLDPGARRCLQGLSLFDVPDFPGWLSAVVNGGSDVARQLEELVDAHLLMVVGTDPAGQLRYKFHDLVRLYARSRAAAEDGPTETARILRTGLGAMLAVAEWMAAGVPGPCFAPITGPAPRTPVDRVSAGLSAIEPLIWFDAEHLILIAAARQAGDRGWSDLAAELAGCLEKYFDVRGRYTSWMSLNRRVLQVCRTTGDRLGEALMVRGLIDVTTWIADDRPGAAMTRSQGEAERLLELFTELNEPGGMSDAAVMCAWALTAQGRHTAAVDIGTRALHWAQEAGHVGGRARAHVAVAVALNDVGQVESAMLHMTDALVAARELGNARYEATVLQFMGIGAGQLGDLAAGERLLGESLEISRRYEDRYPEVLSMLSLAKIAAHTDDERARATAQKALTIAREYRMTHHIADALGLLGELELTAGRPAQAAGYLTESVAMWRTRGWLSFLAAALTNLGRALIGTDPAAARTAWEEAGQLYQQLGDAEHAAELAAAVRSC